MSIHYYEYLARERLRQLYQEPTVGINSSCVGSTFDYGIVKQIFQLIRGIISRIKLNLPDRDRQTISPGTVNHDICSNPE